MKMLIKISMLTMLAVSFSINAGTQDHGTKDGQDTHLMDLVGASDERYMMMVQIAKNPKLRREMIQKIMYSMSMDAALDMDQVMNDPELKADMQNHVSMMQGMLDSDGMDPEKMKALMDNPEMMSMMKMHVMCAQTTDGEKTGDHLMKSGEEQVR